MASNTRRTTSVPLPTASETSPATKIGRTSPTRHCYGRGRVPGLLYPETDRLQKAVVAFRRT